MIGDPHLRQFVGDAIQATTDAESLADDLSASQIDWSPAPGSWSIAQCLEHVAIVTTRFADQLGPIVGHARRRTSRGALAPSPAYRPRWWGRRFLARTTSPTAWRPPDRPLPGARARATDALRRITALAVAADGIDLDRVTIAAPADAGWFRPTVGDALATAIAHARRHIDQARQIRQHPAFPAEN
jgi:hypothetical protein